MRDSTLYKEVNDHFAEPPGVAGPFTAEDEDDGAIGIWEGESNVATVWDLTSKRTITDLFLAAPDLLQFAKDALFQTSQNIPPTQRLELIREMAEKVIAKAEDREPDEEHYPEGLDCPEAAFSTDGPEPDFDPDQDLFADPNIYL